MDQLYTTSDQQGECDSMNVVDATPISVGPPLNNDGPLLSNAIDRQNQENVTADVTKLCQLPVHERQQGWIQHRRKRPSGKRSDKFYYHLESQRFCRTHLEIYDFIANGVLTRRPAEVAKSSLEARLGYSLARKDVKALIQPKVVGSYNMKNKEATRTTAAQMVEAFLRESYENLLNSGVKKRKHEENHDCGSKSSLENKNSSTEGDEVLSEEDEDLSVIPLYDFELNI